VGSDRVKVAWGVLPKDSDATRPEWVFVVGKNKVLTNSAINAFKHYVFEDKKGGELAIFTYDQANEPGFRAAFPDTANPRGVSLETNVLYRRHHNPDRADYYTADMRSCEMNKQRHEEVVDICDYIVAHKVELLNSAEDFDEAQKSMGANLFVPMAVPAGGLLGGGALVTGGLGMSKSKASSENNTRETLVIVETAEDINSVLPCKDAKLDRFYFLHVKESDGGLPTEFRKFVLTNLTGKNRNQHLMMDFALVDQSRSEATLNAQLAAKILGPSKEKGIETNVGGVGLERHQSLAGSAKVRYRYKVTMFSKEVYDQMKRASTNIQVQRNERNRRKSMDIATNRWRNGRIMSSVRQDLLHAEMDRVPAGETSRHRYSDFLGYVREVKESGNNFIRIPITLYGLEGAGKSSVLGTWESAARDSAYGFMEKSWEAYSDRITDPGMRECVETAAVPDVRMDTRENKDKEGNIIENPLPNDWLSTFDVAELIFRDTAPAKDMDMDVRGKQLPFGLLVLVVSARRVEAELRKGASASIPWASLVSDDGSYPPTACIIAGTNNVEHGTTPDELAEWFGKNVGVKNVVAMPTFPVPSRDERADYMGADPISEYRREFNREWKTTMEVSLDALHELLRTIKNHESNGIEDVLDAEAEQKKKRAEMGKWIRAVSPVVVGVTGVAVAAGYTYLNAFDEDNI